MDGAVVIRPEETPSAAHVTQQKAVGNLDSSRSAETYSTMSSGNPTSTRSLSPQEKEAEKVRLQNLVNGFVRNAAQGLPCTYLKEVTGERAVTRYFLDKRLENLVVVAAGDAAVAEVRCPISSIQDIYCLVEDGVGCFPPKVISPLTKEEQALLLMVVYRSDKKRSGDTHRFCLLADTIADRETFLECLRILCIYTQTLTS